MGRPSVQKQRRAEVLEAFLTCAARHGVEGATLEHISKEAGLKRPLIRHHLGNRDDMIRALSEYVVSEYDRQTEELRGTIDQFPTARDFIDMLFSRHGGSDPRLNQVYNSLVHMTEQMPELRQKLIDALQRFFDLCRDVVHRSYPHASLPDCEIVGQALANLYLAQDAVAPVNPPPEWGDAAYEASLRLLKTLEASQNGSAGSGKDL